MSKYTITITSEGEVSVDSKGSFSSNDILRTLSIAGVSMVTLLGDDLAEQVHDLGYARPNMKQNLFEEFKEMLDKDWEALSKDELKTSGERINHGGEQ